MAKTRKVLTMGEAIRTADFVRMRMKLYAEKNMSADQVLEDVHKGVSKKVTLHNLNAVCDSAGIILPQLKSDRQKHDAEIRVLGESIALLFDTLDYEVPHDLRSLVER